MLSLPYARAATIPAASLGAGAALPPQGGVDRGAAPLTRGLSPAGGGGGGGSEGGDGEEADALEPLDIEYGASTLCFVCFVFVGGSARARARPQLRVASTDAPTAASN